MGDVWMWHPCLPPEQLLNVPRTAVPHHRATGWVVMQSAPQARLPAAAAHEPDADVPAPSMGTPGE